MTQNEAQCLKDLKKNYINPGHEIAFSGVKTIYDYYEGVLSKKKIEDFLSQNSSYVNHKIPSRNPKRNNTFCYFLRDKWQADLFEISRIGEYNANHKFVLMVIDVFSRRAFGKLLYSKKPEEVIKKFDEILKEAGSSPNSLFTDKGDF